MSEDRLRGSATFDRAAGSYQQARPDYPDELYRDLLEVTGLEPPDGLLEVGCGPGKATVPLARRGFTITALEPGANLADQARRNLAPYQRVTVHTTSFEAWQPAEPDFDLVYAATAWHWTDPEVRYRKAADLIKPGGYLAVWGAGHAFPAGFDPFFTDIQAVYNDIDAANVPAEWPPPPPEQETGREAEFAQSGLFTPIAFRRYVWALRYTADEYIALLNTFSGHIAMEPANRDYLYGEIRRRLGERPDGMLTRHWIALLTIGQRA